MNNDHRNFLFLFVILICVFSMVGCGQQNSDKKEQGNMPEMVPIIELTSSSYKHEGRIPVKHATKNVSGGANISPQFSWSGAPDKTRSYALIMFDAYPRANNWVHWLVVNIPSDVSTLSEGASLKEMPGQALELNNTFGNKGYGGPQPPAGTGDHEYVTTIYALSVDHLSNAASIRTTTDLENAIDGNILAKAQYTGIVSR